MAAYDHLTYEALVALRDRHLAHPERDWRVSAAIAALDAELAVRDLTLGDGPADEDETEAMARYYETRAA